MMFKIIISYDILVLIPLQVDFCCFRVLIIWVNIQLQVTGSKPQYECMISYHINACDPVVMLVRMCVRSVNNQVT